MRPITIANNGLKPVVILKFELQKFNINLVKSFLSFIKEKQNLCSFFYREKRTKKAPSFVKRSKTTPFRIRNSLVKTFLQYSESPSFAETKVRRWRGVLWERGVSRSNPNLVKFNFYNLISLINKFYTKWIATPHAVCLTASARNDKFKIYNDDKNNFAILNLVKSFLTFITFDSLSRKIKNPCLVINKKFIFKEDIHEEYQKNFNHSIIVFTSVCDKLQ
ncbi:hypothetical protein [Brachyspira sp.]|uniref:hypothetical protein n=1 Tax=Brachyspira sp. TaxID=1977261 RepID=UPI003D7CE635